jgi:hypothetical protein
MIYLDVAFKFKIGFVRYFSHDFQIAVIFRPSNNSDFVILELKFCRPEFIILELQLLLTSGSSQIEDIRDLLPDKSLLLVLYLLLSLDSIFQSFNFEAFS